MGTCIQKITNLSSIFLFIYMVLSLFQTIVILAPLSIFLLVYGEITIKLIFWCIDLKDNVTSYDINSLEKLKQFLKTLSEISNLFSVFLFGIIVSTLFGVIFTTYRSISFILGDYSHAKEMKLISISYFSIFISYLQIFWYFCHFSQTLATKVQELKIVLLNLNVSKLGILNLNESEVNNEKMSICMQLDDFNGYNAEDFFTVNNSLISGMTSNFLTYLIILIQFKLTELSLKKDSVIDSSSNVNSTLLL